MFLYLQLLLLSFSLSARTSAHSSSIQSPAPFLKSSLLLFLYLLSAVSPMAISLLLALTSCHSRSSVHGQMCSAAHHYPVSGSTYLSYPLSSSSLVFQCHTNQEQLQAQAFSNLLHLCLLLQSLLSHLPQLHWAVHTSFSTPPDAASLSLYQQSIWQ